MNKNGFLEARKSKSFSLSKTVKYSITDTITMYKWKLTLKTNSNYNLRRDPSPFLPYREITP